MRLTVQRAAGHPGRNRPPALHGDANRLEQKKQMTTKLQKPAHRLGANRKETTRQPRKRDVNFSQSRDIREDRGERKMKEARARQTMPHLTRGR